MNFTQSIKTCFGKFATFAGTASRSEFWWFYLFGLLLLGATSIVDVLIFAPAPNFNPISSLAQLVILIPTLAAACRRLHDMGRSGWWQLIALTIIGIIPLALMLAWKTKEKDNRFK